MAAATATCSPSSLQLRFALGSGRFRKSPALLARRPPWKQNRGLRYGRIATERRRFEVLSIRSESTADEFSGWSGTDGGEESLGSENKKWSGGNVAFGTDVLIAFCGLIFSQLVLVPFSSP